MPLTSLVLALALGADPAPIVGRADTLGAVNGVSVLVEDVDFRAERLGVNSQALKLKVEDRVLTSGIALLDDEALERQPAAPMLYVRVQMVPVTKARCAAAVEVQLLQLVSLSSGERAWATTWSHATLVRADPRRLAGAVDEVLARQMRGFARTYHAAHGLGRRDALLAGRE